MRAGLAGIEVLDADQGRAGVEAEVRAADHYAGGQVDLHAGRHAGDRNRVVAVAAVEEILVVGPAVDKLDEVVPRPAAHRVRAGVGLEHIVGRPALQGVVAVPNAQRASALGADERASARRAR